jgi:LytS/YehU family sensor histidine kinase
MQLLTGLLFAFIGTIVLWGAYFQWQYIRRWGEPILVLFTLTVFFTGITVYLRRALLKEQRQLQTQVSTQSAQLESLRAQINPHFLFNALNTLYASALKENSEQTANGIQKLAEMMRFMLEENHQQLIPLHKEVEYLHNYIQIQRLRLDESQDIDIRVKLQEPIGPIQIAPMLLSPLVENAFKHGISLEHSSWIYITLTLDEEKLYFKVHNSLHEKTGFAPERERTGVGLENVQKRLSLLYPATHQFMIQQSTRDYFVSLTLPLGAGKPAAEP